MKKYLIISVLLLLLCISGCSLSPKKIEGVWVFSEVNGIDVSQYAAVKGRAEENVAHSLEISEKTAVLEDIQGQTELKLTMEKGGFTVNIYDSIRTFYFDEEKDILICNNGEEQWIYRR